ncbi:MotA/TolQ/ExbB proton channel family protein [Trinickia terrae]|uniref:MotA/TolQ/ExbB proton channel family protein n=1 Tax=Trinickia terrae TaxID=2571161 RepID=A0A4U1I295_9BURK|nr:MotA/TolQ/ExbB proton channel family protein [Trinickia terrae]TKC87314.1 MotA/TolQ/ExbB proton channel family protein [Trinickia terrae]
MSDIATRYIVDFALGLLAMLSALSWALIVSKAFTHWRIAARNRRFTEAFWSAAQRDPARAFGNPQQASGCAKGRLARIAAETLSADAPIASGQQAELARWDRHELLERSFGQQIQRERRTLEQGLTLLASIANVAPFVGLFGTVFGIIHALHAVASGPSSGIAGIAEPVGQALVATGVGIAVAIPAVLAYNLYLRRVRVSTADLEDYAADLVNLAQRLGFSLRHSHAAPAGAASPARQPDEVQA